jgi:elongator complex protein 1
MSLHQISLGQDAIDVHVNSADNKLVALTLDSVEVFSYPVKKKAPPEPTRITKIAIQVNFGVPRQLALTSSNVLAVLCDKEDGRTLIFYTSIKDTFSLDKCLNTSSVLGISTTLDGKHLYTANSSGSFSIYDQNMNHMPHHSLSQPEPCLWTDLILKEGSTTAVGLSQLGNLYVNDNLLARNCTSFLTTPAHLIFTTSQHLLKFVHLAKADDLEVPLDEPEKDERCRSIERGAKLVQVMPSSFSLVLQMPRGNLETIYPRALVLAGIRKSIDEKDYKSAFLACRGHRVDMNIIHDHDPEAFMSNIENFVEQVQKSEYIDLFLSQLK